ncbi:MAG: heme exporter protein CcmD [Proteobacteria bacterium]|nr:heme exporter protein CcmD [Pseudomonadota bacterium]
MREFFAMSGYGLYVWSSLLLTFTIIGLNVYLARRALRDARQMAQRRLAANDSESRPAVTKQEATS